MSHALYKLGRFAARHPWRVIGAWLLLAVVVVSSSSAFGRDLDDSFDAPGLDSTAALDLLTTAQSDSAGLTAQVVLSPLDGSASFFESADAQAALADVQ
ncbi:MMPL family transporter, partial [Acidimicrobiaceae bacterium AH-315-P05]|nr:MMPL family transporter [Acidimicrobiaceae bacterium AH-315-P05]